MFVERPLFLVDTPAGSRAPFRLPSGRPMLDLETLNAFGEPLLLRVEPPCLLLEPPEEWSAPPDLSTTPR
jgi:hypothetical protein